MLSVILAQEPTNLLEFAELGKQLSIDAILLALAWFIYKAYKEKEAENKALNEKIVDMTKDQTSALVGMQEALNRNTEMISKFYDKLDRISER